MAKLPFVGLLLFVQVMQFHCMSLNPDDNRTILRKSYFYPMTTDNNEIQEIRSTGPVYSPFRTHVNTRSADTQERSYTTVGNSTPFEKMAAVTDVKVGRTDNEPSFKTATAIVDAPTEIGIVTHPIVKEQSRTYTDLRKDLVKTDATAHPKDIAQITDRTEKSNTDAVMIGTDYPINNGQVSDKTDKSNTDAMDKGTNPTSYAVSFDPDNDQVTESTKQDNTAGKKDTKHRIDPFVLPDPIDPYSNTIILEGHVFGIDNDILSMIHSSLSSGNIFVPVEPLNIHRVTSSFQEMGYEGDKVTSIRYVVSYNERPIHTEVIKRLMNTPKINKHFNHQLEGRDLRQYKKAHTLENKSWTQQHLAIIVVPSCVGFILVIAIVIAIYRKRRTDVSKQDKKRPLHSSRSNENNAPPPYSVENPVYDFETKSVMDGYTLP